MVLLGPQRFDPTLASVVRSLGIQGRIATVTAGWQEREAEDAELRDHLDARAVNLLLHRRGEQVFDGDRELADANRLKQERLKELQAIYRVRLGHAKAAARELMAREGEPWLLDPEREEAIRAIREIDARHLRRVGEVEADFGDRYRPRERPLVARHREELARVLDGASALAVAGGHVAILLNRMRLFGALELAGAKPVVAWSAGAMVLSERIVLFHDFPPQGPGNAEVLGGGLGAFPSAVALPHARRRLRLDDPARVALFARRFEPAACVALDPGSRVEWDGKRITAAQGTLRLTSGGALEEMAGR